MNWPKQRIGDGLRYDTDGGSDMIMLRIMKLIKKNDNNDSTNNDNHQR